MIAVTKTTFSTVFLRVSTMFYAGTIAAAWVFVTVLLAIVRMLGVLGAMLSGTAVFMVLAMCAMLA